MGRIVVSGVLWAAIACEGDAACVATEACTPQYAPTYDNVYTNTVATSCQLSGCHGAASAQGGVALGTTAEEAYDGLVNTGLVLPGDAACSLAFGEIHSGAMPPGVPLVAEERCAVQQWIDEGAQR